MILLPTRGRPKDAERFMRCARGPGVLIVDESDPEKPDPIHEWDVLVLPDGKGGVADRFNGAFRVLPPQDYYILGGDDLIPADGWASALASICDPFGVAYGPDGLQDKALPTHPCIGGKLAGAVGWLSIPGTRHFYSDNAWRDIGKALNAIVYTEAAVSLHNHFSRTGVRDKTTDNRGNSRDDNSIYVEWHQKHFWDLIRRLEKERER